ncbi:MAG: hypothetical protein MMC33_000612 [Icmadophila ericetorum]|nr:hypothetical protein [Icmadophila ericetorum]
MFASPSGLITAICATVHRNGLGASNLASLTYQECQRLINNDSFNLPAAVDNLFTKQPPIKDVYELVLGPNGSYYIGYMAADGKNYTMHHGLPLHLNKWLSVNAKGFVDHDIRTTQITLGPNGSYVAKDKNKIQWCGVPDTLAKRLNTYGTRGTKLVALGIDDSFVVVGTDGSGLRNLKSKYETLEKLLEGFPNFANVHYLSLSTFNAIDVNGGVDKPLFMLVMKNGSSQGLCPDGHEARFEVVIQKIPNMQVQARPAARGAASGSSGSSFLKVLSSAVKVVNVANQVLNGGNGGGGGGYNGGGGDSGGGFDTSGFTAGLQQQTWSSVSGAAGDAVQ